jgi:hypothetical protein
MCIGLQYWRSGQGPTKDRITVDKWMNLKSQYDYQTCSIQINSRVHNTYVVNKIFCSYNVKMQFLYIRVGAVTKRVALNLGRMIRFWKPSQVMALVAAFLFFSVTVSVSVLFHLWLALFHIVLFMQRNFFGRQICLHFKCLTAVTRFALWIMESNIEVSNKNVSVKTQIQMTSNTDLCKL